MNPSAIRVFSLTCCLAFAGSVPAGSALTRYQSFLSACLSEPYHVRYVVEVKESLPSISDGAGGKVELRSLRYPPGIQAPDEAHYEYFRHPDDRFVFGHDVLFPIGELNRRLAKVWFVYDGQTTWKYSPEIEIDPKRFITPFIVGTPGNIKADGPMLEMPTAYAFPVLNYWESTLDSPIFRGRRKEYGFQFLDSFLNSAGSVPRSIRSSIFAAGHDRDIDFGFDESSPDSITLSAVTEVFTHRVVVTFDPDSDSMAPSTLTRLLGQVSPDGSFLVSQIDRIRITEFRFLSDDEFSAEAGVDLTQSRNQYRIVKPAEVSVEPFIVDGKLLTAPLTESSSATRSYPDRVNPERR